MAKLQSAYVRLIRALLKVPMVPVVIFIVGLGFAIPTFFSDEEEILPKVDEGQISVSLTADTGVNINKMDRAVELAEGVIRQQPEVETIFSTVGGRIFGRSQYEASNESSIRIQLVQKTKRNVTSDEWIERVSALIEKETLTGVRVRMRASGIRGVKIGRGDERISLRLQGTDLAVLASLGDKLAKQLKKLDAIRWSSYSAEENRQELAINVDRARAATFGLSVEEIGDALRFALQGEVVSEYIEGDLSYDIRLRLPQSDISNPQDIEEIILFSADNSRSGNESSNFKSHNNGSSVSLSDVANVELLPSPATILRDQQRRIVEVNATIKDGFTLGLVHSEIEQIVNEFALPVRVYAL
ncbi:MAG: efflux RND transporter permease subunit [Gammaproteobacteria bacterium]|nr:efflux RND transporter permease subunit [Gammaproteobacteria bacterium]